jgi:hypothetical protein
MAGLIYDIHRKYYCKSQVIAIEFSYLLRDIKHPKILRFIAGM